jgi:hypothetical protein
MTTQSKLIQWRIVPFQMDLLVITKALFSSKKICKIFQILRHIESLDTCMKH